MEKAGTFAKSYAFDEHVGRHNVFHIDKDDCHKKPFRTVQEYEPLVWNPVWKQELAEDVYARAGRREPRSCPLSSRIMRSIFA